MSTYHCTACNRPIFKSDAILRRVTLSRFGDHDAEVFAIREAIDPGSLVRYDVSLHEGWYCCRFIMMRMTQDKFGTGRDLLVYADSVVEGPATPMAHRGAIKLTRLDHDDVIAAPENRDKLLVVKHGAIWCPPCRHMDAIITRVADKLPDVRFYDVDIDEEPELAARFNNGSIPFFVFYKNGKQIPVAVPGLRTIGGGLVGAIPEKALIALVSALASVPAGPSVQASAPASHPAPPSARA